MTLPFFIAFAYYILLHWDLNGLASQGFVMVVWFLKTMGGVC